MSTFEPSIYQKQIYDYIDNTNNNLLIEAKAGAGKTSTLIEISNKFINQDKSALFLAFNKAIVRELSEKINHPNILIKTVHSLGFSFLSSYLYRRYNKNYKMNIVEDRNKILAKYYFDRICLTDFKLLNSNLSEEGLKEIYNSIISEIDHYIDNLRLRNINYHNYNLVKKVVIDDNNTSLGNYKDLGIEKFPMVIEQCIDKIKENFENPEIKAEGYEININFTDMIYFPVYYNMYVPYSIKNKLDCILVDECIPGTSWIYTNKGKKPMKVLYKKFKENKLGNVTLKTYNEQTKEFEFKKIVSVVKKGIREVFEIKTNKGNRYRATNNHKFLTSEGIYKRLDELELNKDCLVNDLGEFELVVDRYFKDTRNVFDIEVEDNHNFLVSILSQNALGSSVIVHNCQDLSVLQQLFIKQLDTGNNRFITVGDSKQAIYKFAGSDTNSLKALAETFSSTKLPLSICYRCPKNIIKLARSIVPDIEWNKDRKDEGIVSVIKKEDMYNMIDKDSMILARLNSDLVKIYKEFVFDRKIPVKFKNSDLVNKIKQDIEVCINTYIRKYNNGLNVEVELYKLLQQNPNIDKDLKYKQLVDIKNKDTSRPKSKSNFTVDYILTCMKDYKDCGNYNYKDDIYTQYLPIIEQLIDFYKTKNSSIYVRDFKIFLDNFLKGNLYDDVCIISSIHMAKGSESDKVFIVDYPEFPYEFKNQNDEDRQQETNLQYVAITRAKKELYLCLLDNPSNDSKIDEKNKACQFRVKVLLKN